MTQNVNTQSAEIEAVKAAKRGWYVAPTNLRRNADGKKIPSFYGKSWKKYNSNDPDTVRDWFAQETHLAFSILTKHSDLVIVDIDVKEGDGLTEWFEALGEHADGEIPETFTVRTPSGGMHVYFRNTDETIKNSAKKHFKYIDIRGAGDKNGGLAFGPGSEIIGEEGRYEITNDADVAELPEWLAEKIRPRPAPVENNVFTEDAWGSDERDGKWTVEQFEAQWSKLEASFTESTFDNPKVNSAALWLGRFVQGGFITAKEALDRMNAISVRLWGNPLNEGNLLSAKNAIRDGMDPAKHKAHEKIVKRERVIIPEFTDATMTDYMVQEVLGGKFVRTVNMGWLSWNGKYWEFCDAAAPTEAIRKFVREKFITAFRKEGATPVTKGWERYTSNRKIKDVLTLASGHDGIMKRAEDFDTDEDRINTPEGVLDLRTFEVLPHSPEHLFTKITAGSYRPDEKCETLDMLTSAIPEDARTWLQIHMGQGVSGRPKGRVPAVMLTGEGNNGKTLLTEAVMKALGGNGSTSYAVQVPNEVLLTGKRNGGPSPEKMLLRGARFAYIEETPEGRYLDVEKLKQIVGTGTVTARNLHEKLVTFNMSHVLFINTNYPPRVSEADESTWSRLTAIEFPLRFRVEGDDKGEWLPTDRKASLTLESDIREQKTLDAVFTWLVDGLKAGNPRTTEVPETVKKSVGAWRKEADTLLQYAEEAFVFDPAYWVPTRVFFDAYMGWAKQNNITRPGSMKTVISRLKTHTGLPGNVSIDRITIASEGKSYLPPDTKWLSDEKTFDLPSGKQTMGIRGIRFKRPNVDI